jgi:uncharacterized paraquat-inducible protein A
MIQSYNLMNMRFAQMGLQLLLIISFFFNIMNYHVGDIEIPITGFEAIFKNEYFVIGNIFLVIILLVSVFHLIAEIIAVTKPELYKKLETTLMMLINLQLLTGMLIATFLGTYLELLGILVIGLIVASAYLKHKFKL